MEESRDEADGGEGLMREEEEFVHLPTDGEDGRGPKDDEGPGSDDTPNPIRLLTLGGVVGKVVGQVDGGMDRRLENEAVADPTMEEEESAMAPIRDPQEDIVARGEEEEGDEVRQGKNASSVPDQNEEVVSSSGGNGVGEGEEQREDDEENLGQDEVENVQRLSPGRHDP